MALDKLDTPLQKLLVKILGEENRDYISICFYWETIVGKYIAENSYVSSIEKKTLFVGVANSVIKQELSLISDQLKERIKKKLKIEIKDIVFYIKDDAKKS
ncbi:MAG: DUF721 domain-containing protein [Candidatus Cloacimonetes bacterium]|nr:DUF721 domain-containing protein [Candidatus Cloacimonadota bacterium]